MIGRLVAAASLLTQALCSDTFSEQLNIVRLTDTLSLLQFNFNFELTDLQSQPQTVRVLDYFPAQLYELVRQVPDLIEVEANLVQGRWRDNLVPRVQGFQVDPNETTRDLPDHIGFQDKQPGFSLDVHSQRLLQQEDVDRVFAQASALLQVGIYERRGDAILLEDSRSVKESWLYFAKPNESMCKENFKFIFKHLERLQFDSGLHRLIDLQSLHDTYYKHLKYLLNNRDGRLHLQVQVNYVTEAGFEGASVLRSVKFPVSQLVECAICQESKVTLAGQNTHVVVYNSESGSQLTDLNTMVEKALWDQSIVHMETGELTSVRYISDYSFGKEATFYHNLKNSGEQACEVLLQEHFIGALKPYMHELKILQRNMVTGEKFELPRKEFLADIDFLPRSESLSASLIKVRVEIPAHHEIVVQVGLTKHLQNFMDYPNDPQRGHDIMHMPVQYRYGSDQWKKLSSSALLVQTPEPDFSMPFNVNAATNSMLGVFFINMFNSLVKPKRFI